MRKDGDPILTVYDYGWGYVVEYHNPLLLQASSKRISARRYQQSEEKEMLVDIAKFVEDADNKPTNGEETV